MPSREIIFQYMPAGNSLRVTAVDAATGTEVTIQVPLGTAQADMQRAAMRKLEYVMKKQKG